MSTEITLTLTFAEAESVYTALVEGHYPKNHDAAYELRFALRDALHDAVLEREELEQTWRTQTASEVVDLVSAKEA